MSINPEEEEPWTNPELFTAEDEPGYWDRLDELADDDKEDDTQETQNEEAIGSLRSSERLLPLELAPEFSKLAPKKIANKTKARRKKLENYGRETLGYNPKSWQLDGAAAIQFGLDVFIQSGTGSGKSTVFQVLTEKKSATMLIIAPINALIKEQVAFFGKIKVKAVALTGESYKEDRDIWTKFDSGEYKVAIASPEFILPRGSMFWTRHANKRNHKFLKNLQCIVLDEAHMVWRWGESGYRPFYKKVGDLRVFFRGVPFLLLSATLTLVVKTYLAETLGLNTPSYVIQLTIHRPSIRILVARAGPAFTSLDFLVPSDLEDVQDIPKTILYIDSKEDIIRATNYLAGKIPATACFDKDIVIAPYNSANEPYTRDVNMRNFIRGETRILVSSESVGMGMNIPGVQMVVQFGVSNILAMADVWQRLGRCARDEKSKGLAVVFVEGKHIVPEVDSRYTFPVNTDPEDQKLARIFWGNLHKQPSDATSGGEEVKRTGVDPGLLHFINTTGCRVRAILGQFDDPLTFAPVSDFGVCKCDNCSIGLMREVWDQRSPPENLRGVINGLRADGTPLSGLDREMDRLRNEAVVRVSNLIINDFEDFNTGIGLINFHFPLSRTLRYENTAAAENECIAQENTRLQESQARPFPTQRILHQYAIKQLELEIKAIHEECFPHLHTIIRPTDLMTSNNISKLAKVARLIANSPVPGEEIQIHLSTSCDWKRSLLFKHEGRIIECIRKSTLHFNDYRTKDSQRMPAPRLPPTRAALPLPGPPTPSTVSLSQREQPTDQVLLTQQLATELHRVLGSVDATAAPLVSSQGSTTPTLRRRSARDKRVGSATPQRVHTPVRSRQSTVGCSDNESVKSTSSQTQQPQRKKRKRKYSISPEPLEKFNLDDPLSRERYRLQQEKEEYDANRARNSQASDTLLKAMKTVEARTAKQQQPRKKRTTKNTG